MKYVWVQEEDKEAELCVYNFYQLTHIFIFWLYRYMDTVAQSEQTSLLLTLIYKKPIDLHVGKTYGCPKNIFSGKHVMFVIWLFQSCRF